MRKFCVILSLSAVLLISASASFAAGASKGEVIVVMKESSMSQVSKTAAARASAFGTAKSRAASLASSAGAKFVSIYPEITEGTGKSLFLVSSENKSSAELAAVLKKQSGVLSAVQNFAHRVPQVTPDDAEYSKQWGLKRIGAPKVWNKTIGAEDVYVAVLDTGVLYDHPDLAANMCGKLPDGTYGKMFHHAVSGDNNEVVAGSALEDDIVRSGTATQDTTSADIASIDYATVGDVEGHGTHVAGIIGAVGNNGIGTAGVNWKVKILPVGVFTQGYHTLNNYNVTDAMNYDSDLIAALNYIVGLKNNHGVNIRALNLSIGDWWSPEDYEFATDKNPLAIAMKAASDAGMILCIAAGNENQDIDSPTGDYSGRGEVPSCFKFANTLIVGASASDDKRGYGVSSSTGKAWYFSNYSTSGTNVDVFAPGCVIMSTVSSYSIAGSRHYSRSGYAAWNGTSMAAPMTSGAVALLAAAYPEKSAEEIKALIVDGADSSVLKDGYSRYGLINVWRSYLLGQTSDASGSSDGCSSGAFGLFFIALLAPLAMHGRKTRR